MNSIHPGARLKALIVAAKASGQPVVAPGCYDGLTARLVERAGFNVAYMSGLCVASTLGEPDVGAITADAMVERARVVAGCTGIPLIVDADSGYGGAYNVAQAVRAFETAGAAALHLEDQPFPKKCAAMAGKTLIAVPEMVARLRVALDARRNQDFMIIARTDAFAVEGLDAAIARVQAYEAAGADATIIMSVASEEDMRRITANLRKPSIVMMVEGLRPLVPATRLGEIGYPLVVYPVSLLQAQAHAQQRMLETLQRDGSTAACADASLTLNDINETVGLERARDADAAYDRYINEAHAAS
ncbi:oxaloacetate decarboxylase [Bordetella sp. BOR01]|uniref:isocitrate lyase/PEP mutase family protein n=1 Tax=Bordetella sp. BOR01 TaxID=2854779 RepID=UPI001C4598DF|nr:isocitrate lyase/phosphoenolpyruvate mutase family protein [Bordetella sp. BOR01]MBV7486049.1 isocitrate lyase/phosphoenolpyruvate mutase family protein [Bordetella sp. BOR01]